MKFKEKEEETGNSTVNSEFWRRLKAIGTVPIIFCFCACSSVNHNIKQTNDFVFKAGIEKYLQGETETAYNLLKKASDAEPENGDIKKFLIKVIAEMAVEEVIKGNYKNSQALLEEAIKMNPSDELKEMCERVKTLRANGLRQVKTDKDLPEKEKKKLMSAFFNKGTKLYEYGKYKEAIASWEKVLEIEPKHQQSREVIKKAKKKMASGKK
ncbi:MAG: tetratricopeptide repeat protein [Elusimicrobia bacterium]|nr:tetratricopeptide repeat protein [Elusimicrobiota bacterium]